MSEASSRYRHALRNVRGWVLCGPVALVAVACDNGKPAENPQLDVGPGLDAAAGEGRTPSPAGEGSPTPPELPETESSVATVLPTPDCQHPQPTEKCNEQMCLIEPGCFIMGAPRNEFGAARYNDRQVQVTLTRPFWIGRTEVTRKQWEAISWKVPDKRFESDTLPCDDPDCPVDNVSAFDAMAYANERSKAAGLAPCYDLSGCSGAIGIDYDCERVLSTEESVYDCAGYRLPTEAEWEYAARAGTSSAFYSGGIRTSTDPGACIDDPALTPIAWYCFNSDSRAHPVGSKTPNAWGLFDMSGNVSEWCNDLFDGNGYGEGPLSDPSGTLITSRDLTPTSEQPRFRIFRGGNFRQPHNVCKSSLRVYTGDNTGDSGLGLRLARSHREE